MDPAYWLATGLGAAFALLAAGFFAGRATLLDDLRAAEERLAARMAQVEELLKQGEDGAKAMGLMVQVERALSARRGRTLWGLLPRAGVGSGPSAAPGQASSGGGGKSGRLESGGGDGPPS